MVDIDVSKGTYTLNGKTYKIKGFTEGSGSQIESAAQGKSGVTIKGGSGGGSSSNSISYGDNVGGGGGITKKDVINSVADLYGDVSGKRGSNIPTMDFNNYTKQALGTLSVYGKDAEDYESKNPGSLSKRNNIIAGNLYSDYNGSVTEQNIRDYLNQQAGFSNASEKDQENTIRAIKARLSDMGNKEGGEESYLKEDGGEDRPGYYFENGNWYKILGYDELSDDDKKYADQMSNADRKRLSNEWAADMQGKTKTYLDYQREIEQREEIQGKKQDLYDIQREASVIQAEQTLRQSKEQVDNLIQNWEYLGNMGMPGLSKVKLQAVGDSIKEAETTLGEIKKLQQLSLDAQEKQWDIDVTQYTQQIDNLVYDLNWKVSSEIQNALNKYTTAELEGRLDTIDGVTAFKRSLLEDLDNNISGITEGSLAQMRYITDTYMNMADKAYEEAKLYKENANTVNSQMSAVKGYYVDGNGNAILNSQGLPIQVPQSAPLDPVFDKESGKLITFGYDENGNITANVQQVYQGDNSSMQSTIVSLLENGVSTQDILKYVPGADLKTVQDLASAVNVIYRPDGLPMQYNGVNYTAVDNKKVSSVINSFRDSHKVGSTGGQCGKFVNDYLQQLGIGRLFTDPIKDKTKNINSSKATVGSVVIMDSPTKPEYGHVGIITGIDDNGNMTILQSNRNGDEKVFKSTKNINDSDIYGYFDPQKSIEQYNAEGQASGGSVAGNGFESGLEGYYNKYLTAKMTKDDWTHVGNEAEFKKQAVAYRDYINSQVSTVAKDMMDNIYDIYMWLTNDNKDSPSTIKMNELRLGIPMTKGYTYKRKLEQLLSSTSLNKLIELKSQGATFGALSDNELGFITNASTWLDSKLNKNDFINGIKDKFNEMAKYYGITSLDDFKKGSNGGEKDPYER